VGVCADFGFVCSPAWSLSERMSRILAKLSPPQAGQTIVFFGDSLTEGVDAESGENYPSVLSRGLGLRLSTPARGDTTAEALARIFDAVLSKNPRLVIVLLGGNDFLCPVARQETRKNLEEIVQHI
jgi:acyl-CoA thioesterase I